MRTRTIRLMAIITSLLSSAPNGAAQVPPTPTPAGARAFGDGQAHSGKWPFRNRLHSQRSQRPRRPVANRIGAKGRRGDRAVCTQDVEKDSRERPSPLSLCAANLHLVCAMRERGRGGRQSSGDAFRVSNQDDTREKAESDSHPETDDHSHTGPHRDGDGCAYGDCHAQADGNTNGDTHTDPHTCSDRDLYADSHAHGYSNPNGHSDCHAQVDGNTDGDSHTDPHTCSDRDLYADSHAHGYSNPNGHSDSRAESNSNYPGELLTGRLTSGRLHPNRKRERSGPHYQLHVPQSYSGMDPTPLVFNFHGGGSNATDHETMTQMKPRSDTGGFLLVTPEGWPSPSLATSRTWNAGKCCGQALHDNVDDIAFVNAMIDAVSEELCVDSKRVFATGFSNGAMLSQRLGCELSDRIAAIAPVSGVLENNDLDTTPVTPIFACNPVRNIPVFEIHGKLDTCEPYYGGVGGGFSTETRASVPQTVADWANRNSCSTTYRLTYDNGQVKCWTYNGCAEAR